MQYKNVVSICLSRFLSEYKITDFYDKISLNVGAKDTTSGTIFTFLPWNDVLVFQQIYERDVVNEHEVRDEREVGDEREVRNEREVGNVREVKNVREVVLGFELGVCLDFGLKRLHQALTFDDDSILVISNEGSRPRVFTTGTF